MCTHIPSFVLTTGPHLSAAWDEGRGWWRLPHGPQGPPWGCLQSDQPPSPTLSSTFFTKPTFSTVPWSLHVGALAISPTAPDDRKLTLISNSLKRQQRPTQRSVCWSTTPVDSLCTATRELCGCAEAPGRAGRGEAGAPPAPAPAPGLSPVRKEASACPLVKGWWRSHWGRKLPPDRDAPHPGCSLSGGVDARCSHGAEVAAGFSQWREEESKSKRRAERAALHTTKKPGVWGRVTDAGFWSDGRTERARPPEQGARGPAGKHRDPQGMDSVLLEPMPGSPRPWGSPTA